MTSAQPERRAGHEWHEADRVAAYITRTDGEAAERGPVFDLMARLIPRETDAPLSVLDIGSGHGVVAAAVLDRYPNAKAVGLDISDAMMAEGSQRMARFGDRFRYVVGDFADGVLPPEATSVGPFDVVVSARAIHHLPGAQMATLYGSIFENLVPGGAFFNVDSADTATFLLDNVYRRADAGGRERRERTEAEFEQFKIDRNRDAPLHKHIEWLESAGFESADCFWKRLSLALVGGFKPVN
jgi:tRNA (cmo5U34)-methyltransferase